MLRTRVLARFRAPARPIGLPLPHSGRVCAVAVPIQWIAVAPLGKAVDVSGAWNGARFASTAAAPAAVNRLRREDYRPSSFGIPTVSLNVDLHEDHAVVSSTFTLERQPWCIDDAILLDGDATCVKLSEVWINDRRLTEGSDFTVTPTQLVIPVGKAFPTSASDFAQVRIVVRNEPQVSLCLLLLLLLLLL